MPSSLMSRSSSSSPTSISISYSLLFIKSSSSSFFLCSANARLSLSLYSASSFNFCILNLFSSASLSSCSISCIRCDRLDVKSWLRRSSLFRLSFSLASYSIAHYCSTSLKMAYLSYSTISCLTFPNWLVFEKFSFYSLPMSSLRVLFTDDSFLI